MKNQRSLCFKLGQQEIFDLLKKEKEWLSTKQIEKKLNVSSASRPLSVLLRSKEVIKRKIMIDSHHTFQWKIK